MTRLPEFVCPVCHQPHDDIPAFHASRPDHYWSVPEERRDADIFLTADSCVIEDRLFFIHGLLEVPIHGHPQPFVWGVWVSVSEDSFFFWQDTFEDRERCHHPPFFGWLSTQIGCYSPTTLNLKSMVHLRDDGVRPFIELEPTDHPLAIEQREGISLEDALRLVHQTLGDIKVEYPDPPQRG